jgi:hypothetical protein
MEEVTPLVSPPPQDLSAQDAEALQHFSRWLEGLVADARALAKRVVDPAEAEALRAHAAGALGAVLQCSDLVCDGVEDLGWVEVTLLLRVSARLAAARDPALVQGDGTGLLQRLAAEAEPAARFLGDLGPAFERGVDARVSRAVHGRTVEATLAEPELAAALAVEVEGWASRYAPPALTADKYQLVKLRAFLAARLG